MMVKGIVRIPGLARAVGLLALSGAGLWPASAWAVCTVEATAVSFGGYDVFNNSSTDSTGNVAVTCDVSTSYTLSLSSGAGTYAERYLTGGTNMLLYNLYTDASRTVIWGDGSVGTGQVSGSVSGAVENHTVYGRIPERQNVPSGSYADSIIVTLEF